MKLEDLPVYVFVEGYVCPACKRYNAMLAAWDTRFGCNILRCRDCGYEARPAK